MDFLSAARTLRAYAPPHIAARAQTQPGRVTAESSDDGMDIRIIGSIDWWAGNDVLPLAEKLHDERPSAVSLYIDSPGGDLFDALALRAALEASGAEITAQAGAVVASAAVPVFLAGKTRTAMAYSRFMVHQPRAGFMAFGTAQDITTALAKFVPTLEAALGLFRDTIATHVDRGTVDGWLAQNEDVWMDATEASERGILTEAPAEEDESPTAAMTHLVQALSESLRRNPK